jgi:hypothetical protein
MEFDIERAERLNEEQKALDLLMRETWNIFQQVGTLQTIAWLKKKMDWGYDESMSLLNEVKNTCWL